jgi:N-acetylglucosamine kinase-like BadF-type ATPase
LGDEGSGAVLGKLLVGDVLKKQLPAELCEAFLKRFDLTPASLMEHVYRRPFPNRYLAQFAVFYGEHPDSPELNLLLHDAFSAFVRRNLLQYEGVNRLPIHFVGSIAYHYADVLRVVLEEHNLQAASIRKTLFEQ